MLEEIDIYTKLGLENKTSILNSPQIINKYDLQWNTTGIELDKRFNLDNKNMIKGYFFDVKFLKEVNLKKKILQTLTQISPLGVKGWAITLPNDRFGIKVPMCAVVAKYSDQDYFIDNGHLLAHKFRNYVKIKNKQTNFFNSSDKKPAIINIVPEFDTTNRQFSKIDEQSRFEKYVGDIVEDIRSNKLKNDRVYYEAEAIFYDPHDVLPIGVRLLAYTYKIYGRKDINHCKKLFHVFLPNFHLDEREFITNVKNKNKSYTSLKNKELYRKFFQEYNKPNKK